MSVSVERGTRVSGGIHRLKTLQKNDPIDEKEKFQQLAVGLAAAQRLIDGNRMPHFFNGDRQRKRNSKIRLTMYGLVPDTIPFLA